MRFKPFTGGGVDVRDRVPEKETQIYHQAARNRNKLRPARRTGPLSQTRTPYQDYRVFFQPSGQPVVIVGVRPRNNGTYTNLRDITDRGVK
jgi:hypothetical protein